MSCLQERIMIQNHLTSQPLSKRLKELGVPQKGMYYWTKYSDKDEWKVDYRDFDHKTVPIEFESCRAFLSSELGEILPSYIAEKKCHLVSRKTDFGGWYIRYEDEDTNKCVILTGSVPFLGGEGHTEAEARGLMLEYLILNGLIKL